MFARIRRIRLSTTILLVIVLLTTSASSFPAQPAGLQDPPPAAPSAGDHTVYLPAVIRANLPTRGVVSDTVSPSEQDATLSYWDKSVMTAASAFEAPIDYGQAAVDTTAARVPTAATPGFAKPGKAAPDANKVAQAAYPDDWLVSEEAALDNAELEEPSAMLGTSQRYDAYAVNYYSPVWQVYPHIQVGKFFFTTTAGPSTCTATATSNNTIVTAAHCVYDTINNRFYTNRIFVPAYRQGSAPYGQFAATSCWVLNDWVNLSGSFSINTWSQYDVAVCKVGLNSAGKTLNTMVGWAGRAWDYDYNQHVHNFGYPGQDVFQNTLSFSAEISRLCIAESFYQTNNVRGMGCIWGRGSSGGPWFSGYKLFFSSASVTGVNSGIFFNTHNNYAARFTSTNIVPLCTAAGC